MNSATATQEEFDGMPASSAPAALGFWDYLRLSQELGSLIPQNMLPAVLGVSRQRVWQFVQEKRFETVHIAGQTFITARSFEKFLDVERKNGRPFKDPGVKAIAKAGIQQFKDHKELVKSRRRKS